ARAIVVACAVLALGMALEPAPAPSAAARSAATRARSAATRARSAAAQARSARTRYYLALGDSLAQGMQPEAAGITVDTDQGYADQLYAIERQRIRALKLVKLGCGGETTSSFLSGRGNPDPLILGC